MMNRISNRLIARFVAVAALLALVMAAPAVFAQENIDYPENGTDQVASFSATDADGDPITWSLSGPDAALFEISSDGVLTFKDSPNYESPADTGGDNIYNVTVNASGGSTDVVVTVTNVDEMGSVSLDDLQPQAGASVSATLRDPDGDPSETAWQWSKSMDQAEWTDIDGATSATYAPSTDDIDYYVRATATYSDGLGTGRDSASAESTFAVERRPAANSQPSFAVQDENPDMTGNQVTRILKETAAPGSSVGNAVTATDADNDPLLYSLTDGDETPDVDGQADTIGVQHVDSDENLDTPSNRDGDSTWFSVNARTGQITVSSSKSQADVRARYNQEADTPNTSDLVIVTATDPSGSTASVQVTINVEEVNEGPAITRTGGTADEDTSDTTIGGEFDVTTPEQVRLDLRDITGAIDFSGLPVFTGTDPEDKHDKITWSISGADAKRFQIADIRPLDGDTNSDGELSEDERTTWEGLDPEARATAIAGSTGQAALRWATSDGKGPSFEAMDSADGDNVYLVTVTASDGSASTSKAVRITVVNTEEAGKITLTQLVPQEGIAITARLSDQDGNITGTEWQWYRGNGTLGVSNADGDVVIVPANTLSDTVDLTPAGHLRTRTVVADGPDTFEYAYVTGGTAVTNCVLTEEEIAAGTTVSDTCAINGATSSTYIPKEADAEETLQARATYVDAFPTDTAVDTNSDDDGDVASTMSANPAVVRPNENDLPDFGEDESVDRSVAENIKGASVGDPVTAVDDDPLQYTLSGDGSDDFKVDNSGQITTAEKLDFEGRSSYAITVTATDPSLASSSIVVNITVTDADDPATISAVASIEYAENGMDAVQTFTLNDQDASSGGWSLSGPDAGGFKISEDGELTFKSSPNFESPADTGGDNVYNVTVSRSGGSLDVVVTVTNVDEMGSVSLDDLQPQAGASVSATLRDTDGDPSETAWQWSKSMDQAEWTDIDGATSATYAPSTDDIGYYVRATAEYSDGLGDERDSASAVTTLAVERRPAANSQPSFAVQDENPDMTGNQVTRILKETAAPGSSVGNAVTATDADNDPLLYSLTDGDETPDVDGQADTIGVQHVDSDENLDTPSNRDGDSTWFSVNARTGQITVSSSKSQADVRARYNQEADTPNTSDLVIVTATDPSGSTASVQVTINVEEVNEGPAITRTGGTADEDTSDTTIGGEFDVTTPEQVRLDLRDITGAIDFSGLPVFTGTDPEDKHDKITWSISGADAKRFQIADIRPLDGDTNSDGELSEDERTTWEGLDPEARATAIAGSTGQAALRWATSDGKGPSFEAMDSADGDNVYLVTVTASDGSASTSKAVRITVVNTEEAGKITLTQLVPQEGIAITARLSDQDGNITGTEWQWYRGNGTLGVSNADGDVVIVPANTLSDTVDLTPAGHLRTRTVVADGPDTFEYAYVTGGTAVTNCVLTEEEIAAGTTVSDTCAINGATSSTYIPKEADAEETLQARATYVDAFPTDTAVDTNSDDDGDVASTMSANPAVVRPNENDLPDFGEDESVDRSVAENIKGASVGDPVTAVDDDPLQYTLSGDGSDDFKVDNSGQITTAEKLDFEGRSSYAITVTATDPSLASSSIVVNITVTDADDGATVILLTGNAPAFAADEMTRSVAENTAAGTAVGDPVAATDEDGDALTYTLGGDDADSFAIDAETGQLMTSAALDYETKMSYTVTVSASSGKADELDATTTVTIDVTDEGLDNAYDLNEDGTIERDEVIAAIQDYLAGNIGRSDVTALIRLYFGNGG